MVLFPVDPCGIDDGVQPVNVTVYPATDLLGLAKVIVGVVTLYDVGFDPWFVPPFIVYEIVYVNRFHCAVNVVFSDIVLGNVGLHPVKP